MQAPFQFAPFRKPVGTTQFSALTIKDFQTYKGNLPDSVNGEELESPNGVLLWILTFRPQLIFVVQRDG